MQERLLVFLRKMQLFAHTGEIVEIDKWIHFFSFDVIGELVSSPSVLLRISRLTVSGLQ